MITLSNIILIGSISLLVVTIACAVLPIVVRMLKERAEENRQNQLVADTKQKLQRYFEQHQKRLGRWYTARQFTYHLDKLVTECVAFRKTNNRHQTPDQFLLRQARSLMQFIDRRILVADLEKLHKSTGCTIPLDELEKAFTQIIDHRRKYVESVDLALTLQRHIEGAAPKPKAAEAKPLPLLTRYQEERARQEAVLKAILPTKAGLVQLNAELDRHMNEWMYQQGGKIQ